MFEVAKRLKSETNAHKPSSVECWPRKDSCEQRDSAIHEEGAHEGETESLERD